MRVDASDTGRGSTTGTLLVGPGWVRASTGLLAHAGVLIRGERIARIDEFAALAREAGARATRLDARGGVILPGFVNAHTHAYAALARGMTPPGEPARDFAQILERLWWKVDRALDAEDVRVSALLAFADSVRCGTTTVFDHHASPRACPGSLDALRAAAAEVGLRAALCYEVSDRNGPEAARAGVEENLRFARELRRAPAGTLAACFGLHALFTLGEDTLARSIDAARAAGLTLHLHLAEDAVDVRESVARYGVRPVERLARAGGLGPGTLLAHAVHVDADEIVRLADSGAFVAHNPESNMNNAVGAAPVARLLAGGVRVGLGTDGIGPDMAAAARAAFLLMRHAQHDPRCGWREVPRMLWEMNAQLASRAFGLPVGLLDVEAAADLVVLDYDPPTPLDADNLWAHLVFGCGARDVAAVVCAGRVLMRERALLTVDEPALRARARERAAALWARIAREA